MLMRSGCACVFHGAGDLLRSVELAGLETTLGVAILIPVG
jgi:hypothetical protein